MVLGGGVSNTNTTGSVANFIEEGYWALDGFGAAWGSSVTFLGLFIVSITGFGCNSFHLQTYWISYYLGNRKQ